MLPKLLGDGFPGGVVPDVSHCLWADSIQPCDMDALPPRFESPILFLQRELALIYFSCLIGSQDHGSVPNADIGPEQLHKRVPG